MDAVDRDRLVAELTRRGRQALGLDVPPAAGAGLSLTERWARDGRRFATLTR